MLKFPLPGFLMLFSAALAADQSVPGDTNQVREAESKVEVLVTSQQTEAKLPAEQESTDTQTSTVERFVQPFTRWAEDLIHGSSIVRTPELEASQNKQSDNPKLTIRKAIRMALKRYPGTVLNIEKIETDGRFHFDVNIISDQGVVRTIRIAESNNGSGEQ